MPRRPRITGFIRRRPSANRVMQRLWEALRESSGTTAEIAGKAEASINTAKNCLRRWHREGLVSRADIDGDGATFPRAVWTLACDLGPIAPVLRGHMHSGSGYTDPNKEDAGDARSDAQAALKKLRKAMRQGTGCRLTATMVKGLAVTLLGEAAQ